MLERVINRTATASPITSALCLNCSISVFLDKDISPRRFTPSSRIRPMLVRTLVFAASMISIVLDSNTTMTQ